MPQYAIFSLPPCSARAIAQLRMQCLQILNACLDMSDVFFHPMYGYRRCRWCSDGVVLPDVRRDGCVFISRRQNGTLMYDNNNVLVAMVMCHQQRVDEM